MLETAIVDLTKSVALNNELLQKLLAKTAGGATDKPASKPEAEAEVEEEPAPKKRTKKVEAEEEPAPKKRAPKAKAISDEELAESFSEYLATDDEAERARRKVKAKRILTMFEAPKAREIAQEHRAEALKMVKQLIADLASDEDDAPADEDDDDVV
jgi:hypothetical protein